jgi:Zn-dependent protease
VGILTSLLFFASVLIHELGHSVVAMHYRIPVESITLFVFGGVAQIGREPERARQEFNIAIAGPLTSLLLAGMFFALTKSFPYDEMVGALALWLAGTNAILAVFNLVPGFPLDGGRVLRAIIWGVTKNFIRATRIAGTSGKIIAYGMILVGAVRALSGEWFSGLWLAFIGWFLLTAAQESVAQITVREALVGLRAADVMSHEVPTIPRNLTLEEYGADVLRSGRRCHLVLSDGRLLGMMNVQALNAVQREEWPTTSVQAVMIPREKILWATPQEPLLGLLERLVAADVNQMPVVSEPGDGSGGANILGMVTRDSILRVIQTHGELGHLPR